MAAEKAMGLRGRSGDREPQEFDQQSERVDFEPIQKCQSQQSADDPWQGLDAVTLKLLGMKRLSPFEEELTNCEPVVCDHALWAHLFERGIRTGQGFFDALKTEAVVFLPGGRFEFAKHLRDATGAVRAIIISCRNQSGEIVDIAAWLPDTGAIALWRGSVGALGEDNILAPRIDPLLVCETATEWLRAGRKGVFIIDLKRAAAALDGQTLAAADRRFGRALRSRLAPFMSRPPRIVVPEERHHG